MKRLQRAGHALIIAVAVFLGSSAVLARAEHLARKEFDAAFSVALSSNGAEHLPWLLHQVVPTTVLGVPCLLSQVRAPAPLSALHPNVHAPTAAPTTPMPPPDPGRRWPELPADDGVCVPVGVRLQGVILSLLSHLGVGLDSEPEAKLHWITEAGNSLDVNDPHAARHARCARGPGPPPRGLALPPFCLGVRQAPGLHVSAGRWWKPAGASKGSVCESSRVP